MKLWNNGHLKLVFEIKFTTALKAYTRTQRGGGMFPPQPAGLFNVLICYVKQEGFWVTIFHST